MQNNEIVFYNAPFKNAVYALLSAGFAVGAAAIVLTDNRLPIHKIILLWIGVLFFGYGVTVFVRRLFDKEPRIVINDVGILDRSLGVGVIEWRDIRSAYIWSYQRSECICLELYDTKRYTKKLSPVRRLFVALNRAVNATPFSITASGTNGSTEQVMQPILRRITAVGRATPR